MIQYVQDGHKVSKLEQLDKLTKAIQDCEIRLKSVENAVEQIDKEINILSPRQTELEQNIEFHKKATTIPLAHEYKKAKNELSKTKARLILIRHDKKKSVQACKDIEEIIEKFKKDHADLVKTSENNVLSPNFGGKRGKN